MSEIKRYLLDNDTEQQLKLKAEKALKEARGAKKVVLHNLYVDIWGDV